MIAELELTKEMLEFLEDIFYDAGDLLTALKRIYLLGWYKGNEKQQEQ